MLTNLKSNIAKYFPLLIPILLILVFITVNSLNKNICEYSQNKTFRIFDKGYIKYKNARQEGENLFIDGAGQFEVVCTKELFTIRSKNSAEKFNFDGIGVSTLYGFVYSNDTKRMGVSLLFKNPIIYIFNLLIILSLVLYLIKYNLISSKYVNYSLIPLLIFTYYLEIHTSLSANLPSFLRILLFSIVVSKLLVMNNIWPKIIRYKYIFIFYFLCILFIFYKQDLSLSMHPAFGRHWFYQLDSLIQNFSLSLGELSSKGLFYDALVYKNNGYMPNNIGPVIFAFLFGSELFKLGITVISIITALNFFGVYENIVKKNVFEDNQFLILIILILIVTPAIILSGTYYPIPQIGSAFFMSMGFISLVREKKITTSNLLLFSVATLFRIESIFVLFFALLIFFDKSKKIVLFIILSLIVFFLSNYIKFDDFFQSGIGYNHNINNPQFKPVSHTYLLSNLYGYFIKLPIFYYEFKTLFLKFTFNGSEPGGYFFLKYPLVLVGLFFLAKKLKVFTFNSSILLILLSGLSILAFYLLGFNTSPKYDVMFAPLILLALVQFSIKSKLLKVAIVLSAIIIHCSVLLNLIVAYPFYK